MLFGLIPVAGIFIGGLFGLAAIVLGIIGIFKSHRLMAIIGIALAVVGLIVTVIVTIAVGRAVEDVVDDWPSDLEDLTEFDTDDTEAGDGTDPGAPLPAGSEVDIGNWVVSFSDVVPDATDTVLAENEFNEPPAEGQQFFMFQVNATYEGEASSSVYYDLLFGVYAQNTVYTEYCGVVPDDVSLAPEVYQGGTSSGNACVAVPSDGVDEALITVEDWSLGSGRYFVSAQ